MLLPPNKSGTDAVFLSSAVLLLGPQDVRWVVRAHLSCPFFHLLKSLEWIKPSEYRNSTWVYEVMFEDKLHYGSATSDRRPCEPKDERRLSSSQRQIYSYQHDINIRHSLRKVNNKPLTLCKLVCPKLFGLHFDSLISIDDCHRKISTRSLQRLS